MKNNVTPDDIKIRFVVKKYLDMQVTRGIISPFCAVFSEKLVMNSIELESKTPPLKINNLMQLKKMEYLIIVLVVLMLFAPKKIKETRESSPDEWIKYDFMDLEKRPKQSGKYFVHRKDGKVHWEQWNGCGFAYNGNSITHFRKINPPQNC